MLRTILVPVDGSTFSEQALPWALSLARRAGASLRLVTVHVPVMYVDQVPTIADSLDRKLRDDAGRALADTVRRVEAALKAPVASTLMDGPIAESIQEHALACNADLIVMTTHGRGPFTRFWLGSVADEMMRRSTVPLFLVRPAEGAPDLEHEPVIRHLLVPLDGSSMSEQILEPAVDLARLMQADLCLFRVVKPILITGYEPGGYAVTDGSLNEQLQVEARDYLEGIARRLGQQGVKVQTKVALDSQPARAILDEAAARKSDAIALETHGRQGLARMLLGSVADKVVRGAGVPVLVHRPARS
jgi:nucleotide-binding universal stress UspA family protein